MGIAEELVLAENKVKYRALIYCCGSIINVLALLCLTPSYGAVGASIAISLSLIVAYTVLATFIYKLKFNLDMPRFYKECQGKILPFLILIYLFYIVVNHVWITSSLLSLLVKIGACSIVGFIVLWATVMNNEERQLIKSFFITNSWDK